MQTVKITNSKEPIFPTYDFRIDEFWNPIKKDFEMYECLYQAMQVFRDWATWKFGFDFPLDVTSTWRPKEPLSRPPAHRLIPPAIDHCPTDRKMWQKYRAAIIKEMKEWRTSVLMQSLLDTGTKVIIFEPTCMHMHWRDGKDAAMGTNNHPDDEKYPLGIYLGSWQRVKGNPKGKNISYSA